LLRTTPACSRENQGGRHYPPRPTPGGKSAARPSVEAFSQFPLDWIEEPIPADEPPEHGAELAMLSRIPLAGGENLIGFPEFDAAIAVGHLGVIQPDICKWGGSFLVHRSEHRKQSGR
jgi:Enolase C-terminal domain-like